MALWEAPGKKEGFLECETHGDLEDLEDTLKKFFLAELSVTIGFRGWEGMKRPLGLV